RAGRRGVPGVGPGPARLGHRAAARAGLPGRDRARAPAEGLRRASQRDRDGLGGRLLPGRARPHRGEEGMNIRRIDRRRFLVTGGGAALAAWVLACQEQAVPVPTRAPEAAKPTAPTPTPVQGAPGTRPAEAPKPAEPAKAAPAA